MDVPHAWWLVFTTDCDPLPLNFALLNPMSILMALGKLIAWIINEGALYFGFYFPLSLLGYLATFRILEQCKNQKPTNICKEVSHAVELSVRTSC